MVRKRTIRLHCPTCKKLVTHEDPEFPFCSERCRLRDLGNWAAEKYVVSEPIFSEDEDEVNDSPSPYEPEH